MEKQRLYIGSLSDPIENDNFKSFITAEIASRKPAGAPGPYSVDDIQIMRDAGGNCRGFGFVTLTYTKSGEGDTGSEFWGLLTRNNAAGTQNPIMLNGKVLRFELAAQSWKDKLSAEKAQEAKIEEKKQKRAEAIKKLLDPVEASADADKQLGKIRGPGNKLIDPSLCAGKRKTFGDDFEEELDREIEESKKAAAAAKAAKAAEEPKDIEEVVEKEASEE